MVTSGDHAGDRRDALSFELPTEVRFNWSPEQIRAIYDTPLLDLVFRAASVHRKFHDASEIQICKLISIKTGGCPEDCAYCSQSSRYQTEVEASPLMQKEEVLEIARRAKAAGVTRVCMGAAWRDVPNDDRFGKIVKMVEGVSQMGMEACVTMGMLRPDQAQRLAKAGLTAYNHNLDTSESFYPEIITTRTYRDRLETIQHVAEAGIQVCCGGIVGMGETDCDRIALLHTLANLSPQPESVPINALSPVAGTPFGDLEAVDFP